MGMNVWIDQDSCTGSGLCAKKAPNVFTMKDNVAHVQADGAIVGEGGPSALARVPDESLDAVIKIADECEGQCIFLEIAED
jgi:ferredoxin